MFTADFAADRKVLEAEYGTYSFAAPSGDDIRSIEAYAAELLADASLPYPTIKARIMARIMTGARICLCDKGIFADRIEGWHILADERAKRIDTINGIVYQKNAGAMDAREARFVIGDADFSHTAPDWEDVFSLGIPGLLDRLNAACQAHEQGGTLTKEKRVFYEASRTVLEAFIVYLGRLADEAERIASGADDFTKKRMAFTAKNLRNLKKGAPQTFAECLQLIFTVYYIHQAIEGENLRSLGRFDKLLYPFYRRDIENGTATEEQQREIIRYFHIKCGAIHFSANMALTLAGLDEDGNEVTNELTYALLEEYDALNIYDPKFQIRFTDKLPDKLLCRILRSIRDGRNSYVFMNDRVIERSLIGIGASEKDARAYIAIGCYESTAKEEVPCTCVGRVSLPKAVEYAVTGGVDLLSGKQIGLQTKTDFDSFGAFYETVKTQLADGCARCIGLTNAIEEHYMYLNPSPFFSAAMKSCVKSGTDVYAGGAKYSNTSINLQSLGTAVDAICAVKTLVFEEKCVTMDELRVSLKNDWNGYEELRQKALRCPKFGTGDKAADEIAADLAHFGASCINGKKNARNGVYRCGFFTIDWRFDMGTYTGASADGRKAGSPLSKNMDASDGRNTRGVTALIVSSNKVDMTEIPNSTVLDLSLHASAVKGDDGIEAMAALIKTFMATGGYAVHVNVLSADALREAKANPEAHKDLQIRVCGWNAAFVNLSETEQDGFIAEASAGE